MPKRPNQAMQRTASRVAIHLLRVSHPPLCLRGGLYCTCGCCSCVSLDGEPISCRWFHCGRTLARRKRSVRDKYRNTGSRKAVFSLSSPVQCISGWRLSASFGRRHPVSIFFTGAFGAVVSRSCSFSGYCRVRKCGASILLYVAKRSYGSRESVADSLTVTPPLCCFHKI
jgi:hypothetical protein